MNASKISRSTIIFAFFVVIYAILLVIYPQVGADNDYHFLRTLQSGKPLIESSKDFPYADTLSTSGRYMPMVSMEYNFIGLFSTSPSPFWYYLYHAVQLTLFAFLFTKLLLLASPRKNLIYGAVTALLLIPASTIGWFRLQNQERDVLFFFAAFLLAYLSFSKNQKIWSFLLALGAANLAIYYKEIPFLAIGVFAFAHLIFSWKKRELNRKGVALDVLLMLSSATYLLLYYLIVYRHSSLAYLPNIHTVLSRIKVFANYGFFSDSALVLLLIPLTLWRLWKIFVKKIAPEPVWDAMLLGASAYIGSFFALNLYGPYYFLPAYGLGLPAIFYFFRDYSLKTLPLFFKAALGVTVFCLIFNAIPSGLYYLTFNKYYPVNFNKTADFLVRDINTRAEKNPGDKPSIFLYAFDGGNSTGIQGTYFILYDNLVFRGLDENKFDMKSEIETTTDVLSFLKIKPPHTVFSPSPAAEPKSGDYLLVTPKSMEPVNRGLIERLGEKYDLVFETKSPLALPDINLKTLAKLTIQKQLLGRERNKEIIHDSNIFVMPDHYVFVKK